MIKVCDAIMGSGKTESTISYINSNLDKKFVYITPYLDEADRIKRGCPEAHFIAPSKLSKYNASKSKHTAELLKEGRNIASTHQAFKYYTPEMLEDIRIQHYTLIIDENMDVLENLDYAKDDIEILEKAGYLQTDGNKYIAIEQPYAGDIYKELFRLIKSRELLKMEVNETDTLFYWTLPKNLIDAFDDVIVLTYLFEGQGLHNFFKMYDMEYIKIGVIKDEHGFHFSEDNSYIPEYVSHLKDMIDILDHDKLNSIGDEYYDLSMAWFEKDNSDVTQLKNNLYNYFRHIDGEGVCSSEKMWASYSIAEHKVRGKGYSKGFVNFNEKATNKYAERRVLAYCANPFMNVSHKLLYKSYGIEVDEELYALSVMVQWIWRSAIRTGEKIYIYIPSSRMRNLLIDWINSVSGEGVCNE